MRVHLEKMCNFFGQRYLRNGYVATLVTASNSGSSFLNQVELQNGCLALGHSNLFILSTLAGANINGKTGKLHVEKYRENMELATETSRVETTLFAVHLLSMLFRERLFSPDLSK